MKLGSVKHASEMPTGLVIPISGEARRQNTEILAITDKINAALETFGSMYDEGKDVSMFHGEITTELHCTCTHVS